MNTIGNVIRLILLNTIAKNNQMNYHEIDCLCHDTDKGHDSLVIIIHEIYHIVIYKYIIYVKIIRFLLVHNTSNMMLPKIIIVCHSVMRHWINSIYDKLEFSH
jgi:glycosyltransferase involved in cell wall biosynthesis